MPPKPPRPALIRQSEPSRRQPGRQPAPPAPPRPGTPLAEKLQVLARQQGLATAEDPQLLEELASLQASQDIPPHICLVAAAFLAFAHQADTLWGGVPPAGR
jgi:type III secretion system FlhB-like substrate exporter